MSDSDILIILKMLHDLGVAMYVGGTIYQEFVLAPAQQAIPTAQSSIVGQKTGFRFALLAWASLILIGVTGPLRLYYMKLTEWEAPWFLKEGVASSDYGHTLGVMVLLYLFVFVNGVIMTFILRPRLEKRLSAKAAPGAAQRKVNQMMGAAKWVTYLTRVDLVLLLILVALGSSLAYGGLIP